MPKFIARSILDLMTPEREAGRVARGAHFIVAVEVDDGSWVELDADDKPHAAVIADNWVAKLNARGASCWAVFPGCGGLADQPFYTRYATFKD